MNRHIAIGDPCLAGRGGAEKAAQPAHAPHPPGRGTPPHNPPRASWGA